MIVLKYLWPIPPLLSTDLDATSGDCSVVDYNVFHNVINFLRGYQQKKKTGLGFLF